MVIWWFSLSSRYKENIFGFGLLVRENKAINNVVFVMGFSHFWTFYKPNADSINKENNPFQFEVV